MLRTGLSHGVAVIPKDPKYRYTCPKTGAHFSFDTMCSLLETMERKRALIYGLSSNLRYLNKDFYIP